VGFKVRLSIGVRDFAASRGDELRAAGLDPEALRAALGADLAREFLAPRSLVRQSAAELRRSLALAIHLGRVDAAGAVLEQLESRSATARDRQLVAILRALVPPEPAPANGHARDPAAPQEENATPQPPAQSDPTDVRPGTGAETSDPSRREAVLRPADLPPEDLARLRADLGWFADLLLYSRAEEPAKSATWAPLVFEPAREALAKVAVAVLVGLALAILCLGSFVGFLVPILRGRLRRCAARSGAMEADYALEIFAFYLLGTLALSAWVRWFAADVSQDELLLLNIGAFLAMTALVAWPLLFGVPFEAVRMRLGLWLGGPHRLAQDLLLGPLSYLASWVVLALVLVLYALFLTALGVDASQGTHPVVPILLAPQDERTVGRVLLLGVVVAPVIEEIMFRGALYGWLRSRFGPLVSIGASALAFAAVHPQGLIGIVPLTFLGCVFGALREWRGNLVTPILAHACFNGGTLAFVLFVFGSA